MKNKILAGVMILGLAIGITACGGKNGAENISGQPEAVSIESLKQTDTETQMPHSDEQQEIQETQNSDEDELDKQLAEYREYRESVTAVPMGNGVTGSGDGPKKNPEDFGFSFDASPSENFDARELTEGFEAGKKYVENNLGVSVETKHTVYLCVDPRIWAIYEAEDKGVASGYEPENIFVCEYCDGGTWQYLILVREGKDSAWEVIHHGSSYTE